MINGDALVNSIFEAARKESGTAEDRRIAIVRAGLIAQAYCGSPLVEDVFGPNTAELLNLLQHDKDNDGSSGSSWDAAAH
jgi:hypothetical protein